MKSHRNHLDGSPAPRVAPLPTRGGGIGAILLALCLSSPPPIQAGEETPHETTDEIVKPAGGTAAGSSTEPRVDPDRELEAIVAAFMDEPFKDPPESDAVAEAIAELQAEPPPEDEAFALITVTDRATGERRMFTRGTPKPEIALYLEDPSSAPKGVSYSESDDVTATEKVEIVVRSVSAHAYTPPKDELTLEEEEELDLKERNTGTGLSHRIEQGLHQRVASGEIDLASSQPVPVAVTLKNVPELRLPKSGDVVADALLWLGLDLEAEREKAVIARKQAIADLQAEAVADIEGIADVEGLAGVLYASWTSGLIEAEIPAKAIPILADRDDVFSLEYVEPAVEDDYQGDDYYGPSNAEDFDPFHAGFNGFTAKHPYTSRVVLALSEVCIDQANPGWDDFGGGPSRGFFFDCDPLGPCTQGGVEACSGPAPPVRAAHGTWVAGVMTSDFMDGQDPAVTAANALRMTGTCPECRFFFFQDQGINNRLKALDAACDFSVDVFQSSISFDTSCDGNGWMDGAVQALVDCDAVYVKSASNRGSTGGCTTAYPSDHPWTFTVGGMFTDAPCNTPADYFTGSCPYDVGASRGGGLYNVFGTASIIDQTAPFRFANLIDAGTAGPVTFGSGNGTSFSTPLVAGWMGRMLDWYRQHVSTSIFFNNRMRNFMLLFADRSVGAAGTSRALNFHDSRWGSGRSVLFPFDDEDGWNMRRRSRTLASNTSDSFTTAVSPNATFFKAVVWHDGRDYQNEPAIELTLNPLGCNAPTRTVTRLDSKAMLVYESILDGCTGVRVTIRNDRRGTSGTRVFHYASLATDNIERNW